MLDQAVGPNVIKRLLAGLDAILERHAADGGPESKISEDSAAIASSRNGNPAADQCRLPLRIRGDRRLRWC